VTGALSDADIARFRRDGVLFPVRVLTRDEAAWYRGRLEAFEAAESGRSRAELHHQAYRFKPHLLFTWLDELIHRPRLLDAVESLIGPDLLVWSSAFFLKDPGDRGYLAWHQDSWTYGLAGGRLVTAWIALTDSRRESGAMKVLPGSHRLGPLAHRETFARDNLASRGETVDLHVDPSQTVDVILDAGEVSFHDLHTVHASDPNVADARRIGYAIRYMTPSMRPAAEPASALLVRGRDTHGHFELEPRPARDGDPAARTAYERAMRLRREAVFRDPPPGPAGAAPPAARDAR
jgi:non-haem Fe2+, alpha-ketoglutarate-dependent halogenase